MRFSPYAAVPVVVGALLLVAGCGATDTGSGSGSAASVTSTTPTGVVSPSPTTTTPALPTDITTPPPAGDPTDPPLTGRSRPITATGKVTASDAEKRCLVMTISGQRYLLTGDGVDKLHDGQSVTVTGYADDTVATTCQVGVVFVVTKLAAPGGP